MSWLELSVDAKHEAVDWIRTLLAGTHDANDIQITPYIEPELLDLSERDRGVTQSEWAFTICLYLPYDIRVRERLDKIEHLLSPLHRVGLTTELRTTIVEEKSDLSEGRWPIVRRIGQRFIILSPDTPYQSAATDEVTIRLESSLSFGSGFHPATMISLQLIERHLAPAMNTLDLGSGSGILSVAMAKLGAQVLALDNDGIAVRATQEAASLNGVEQQVTAMEGSLGLGSELGHWMGGEIADQMLSITAQARFDLIVANILARVQIALAPDFRRALRRSHSQGGLLITAGFTTDHEDEVTSALAEAEFEAIDCERLGEWVGFAHRLRG